MATYWKHEVLSCMDKPEIVDTLKRVEKEGWELAAIFQDDLNHTCLIVKRPDYSHRPL